MIMVRHLTFVFTVLLGLSTALVAVGCTCTEVGCMGVLNLSVAAPDGSFPADLAGTVTVEGRVTEFDCASEQSECADGVIRIAMLDSLGEELSPGEEVTVDIASESTDLAFIGSADVDLGESFSPNGVGCGPTCVGGTASVDLEAR